MVARKPITKCYNCPVVQSVDLSPELWPDAEDYVHELRTQEFGGKKEQELKPVAQEAPSCGCRGGK